MALKGHSPGLQYFLGLFTGQNVYEKALQQFHRIFRPDGEDEILMRKALDMDYELGERLESLRQQEIEAVEQRDEGIGKQAPIEGLMAISIDATKVREKLGEKLTKTGKKRYDIGFKDAKVAAVSAVVWDAKAGEASCVDSSCLSAVEEADEFFKRIWVEMSRRGVDPERQLLVFLGDGASGIGSRIWPTAVRSKSLISTMPANTSRMSARPFLESRPRTTAASSTAGRRCSFAARPLPSSKR